MTYLLSFSKTKFISLFILCCGLSFATDAQTITVLSAKDSLPLEYVYLSIANETGSYKEILVTNSEGKAHLPSTNGKILITLSFLGYETQNDILPDAKQNKTYYLKQDINILDPVVLTAQYQPDKPENAVHRIRVIDNKKIETMGAVNLRDVLTNELNIRISQDNVLGSGMSIQGISGQNVKILIDGVPVIGRLDGNIDISQINMNNVERIEVIEGPLSVTYGTDALGGTINIITKKDQKEEFSLSATSFYESTGQFNNTGRVGIKKGKNSVTLAGGRNNFDGWRNGDNPFYLNLTPVADQTRFQNWKPKEQLFGTVFYGHRIKNLQLGLTGDYFTETVTNRGNPRTPYFQNAFDDYYHTYRLSNTLTLSGKLNDRYYLNIIASHNYFKRTKNTYFKDLTTLEEHLSKTPGDQDTSIFRNLMSRGTLSKTVSNAKLNYELGYDLNYETGVGIRMVSNQQSIGDYAIFGSAEYKPVSSLTIRPALRVMHNTAYKAPLIPSLNIKYSLRNQQNRDLYTLRASYARGFRSPALKELYFLFVDINHNIQGNDNLKAENSHNFSAALTFKRTKAKHIFQSELSSFYNSIENMISLAHAGGTLYSYFNIDRYRTRGIQWQNELLVRNLKVLVGAAYVGRYNYLSETYSNAETFSYSPEGRANFIYDFRKPQITVSVFYKYTGKLPGFRLTTDEELQKSTVQDYHTADLSVSKLFLKKRLNFSIGAKNLFNVTNVEGIIAGGAHSSGSSTMPVAMGRTYFFRLTANLNSNQ